MAQLVAVCRAENHQFRRRQLPLVVDDSLTVSIFISAYRTRNGETSYNVAAQRNISAFNVTYIVIIFRRICVLVLSLLTLNAASITAAFGSAC